MFPVDALPAIWMEEREAEMKVERERKAQMALAAQVLARSGVQSAPATPLASPHSGFGFIAGFFSSITRNGDNAPCLMSRSSSSNGKPSTNDPCFNQNNQTDKTQK